VILRLSSELSFGQSGGYRKRIRVTIRAIQPAVRLRSEKEALETMLAFAKHSIAQGDYSLNKIWLN
jgi:hypothetical protein